MLALSSALFVVGFVCIFWSLMLETGWVFIPLFGGMLSLILGVACFGVALAGFAFWGLFFSVFTVFAVVIGLLSVVVLKLA